MIFTVKLKYLPGQHLGMVNEPTPEDALLEADRLYGTYWDDVMEKWVHRQVMIEPGNTQRRPKVRVLQ